MFRMRSDAELIRHRLRPPCPRCQRKTWPTCGLDGQLLFRCFVHGHWVPDTVEDHTGHQLPYFRWRIYDWRFL